MITTGMRASAGACLMRVRNSQPSTLGSMMSRVMSETGCLKPGDQAAKRCGRLFQRLQR